jgi:hypothetical protein
VARATTEQYLQALDKQAPGNQERPSC